MTIGLAGAVVVLVGCGAPPAVIPGGGFLPATLVTDEASDYRLVATPTNQPLTWRFEVRSLLPTPAEPLEFEWDFGDGTTARGATHIHPFPGPGTFVVTVFGLDARGLVAVTLTAEVDVSPAEAVLIASAGSDQTAGENVLVFLDGTGSVGPDGAELTFRWSQITGPTVLLRNASTPVASFVTPSNGLTQRLVFALEVSDGQRVSRDIVAVDVLADTAPGGGGAVGCRFTIRLSDGTVPTGEIDSDRPVTLLGQALRDDGQAIAAGTLIWSLDGTALPETPEVDGMRTLALTTGGVHTVAVALSLAGATIGCRSTGSGLLDDLLTVRPLIVGQVRTDQGVPLLGIAVSANAGGGTDVTDANGAFRVSVPFRWSGSITPQHVSYDFIPPQTSLSNVSTDVELPMFIAVARATPVRCQTDATCNDGVFCNGVEQCISGICTGGTPPCGGRSCDEAARSCGGCQTDADCDDGNPCTADTCIAGGQCVATPDDANVCDDGVFCNGTESCAQGTCVSAGDPCAGQTCDEGNNTCVAGQAVSGLLVDAAGSPRAGIDVVLTGAAAFAGVDFTVRSDTSGTFLAIVPTGWSGSVSSSVDHRFEPVSVALNDVSAAVAALNFTVLRNYYIATTGRDTGSMGTM
ncbi:MAG: PKD domain-containing protein, partial [Phycisphaerae bacterium]